MPSGNHLPSREEFTKILIRLRHDEDDDASDGGHAKIDCHAVSDGNAQGGCGGYGETMANPMVLVMAMAMMMVMAVVINTRQRSQHCNLVRVGLTVETNRLVETIMLVSWLKPVGLRVETSMLVSWLRPACWSHV